MTNLKFEIYFFLQNENEEFSNIAILFPLKSLIYLVFLRFSLTPEISSFTAVTISISCSHAAHARDWASRPVRPFAPALSFIWIELE